MLTLTIDVIYLKYHDLFQFFIVQVPLLQKYLVFNLRLKKNLKCQNYFARLNILQVSFQDTVIMHSRHFYFLMTKFLNEPHQVLFVLVSGLFQDLLVEYREGTCEKATDFHHPKQVTHGLSFLPHRSYRLMWHLAVATIVAILRDQIIPFYSRVRIQKNL